LQKVNEYFEEKMKVVQENFRKETLRMAEEKNQEIVKI